MGFKICLTRYFFLKYFKELCYSAKYASGSVCGIRVYGNLVALDWGDGYLGIGVCLVLCLRVCVYTNHAKRYVDENVQHHT